MEIVIQESSKTKLIFELNGADHTFCNVLKDKLLQSKDVEVATYTISHPLVGKPLFIVETDKKSPKDVLSEAVKGLNTDNKEFLKQIKSL